MWRNIIMQSIFQSTTLIVILFMGNDIFKVNQKVSQTIFFTTFVFMQVISLLIYLKNIVNKKKLKVINSINSRKLKRTEINVFSGIFKNPLFILIQTITVLTQVIFVQFAGKFLHSVPLTFLQFVYCFSIACIGLIVGIFIKIFPDKLFNKIKIFRNKSVQLNNLDRSLTSILRKKGSKRITISSFKI